MTMNSSGPLSMGGSTVGQSINLELGQSATATISLNDANVRTLLQVPSGAISMSAAYGKSNRPTASTTYTTNTTSISVNVSALSGYVAGSTDVTITINAGVYLYSTSTTNYALTVTGGTTGDTITIVNNGFIMGMGGRGYHNSLAATAGGPAIDISGIGTASITINNQNGYIGGGGGGGNGGTAYSAVGRGGGGAGGGAGGNNAAAAASPGAAGANGTNLNANNSTGGNGGRIMPGTGGASVAGGPGVRNFGLGGGAGGSGSTGQDGASLYWGGGGGGYGAAGGRRGSGTGSGASGAGGSAGNAGGDGTPNPSSTTLAGGKAINTSTKTVTWVGGSASSSRAYGAVA